MQTFLPYPDYARSVAILDSKRLGKQRIENFQMLKALVLKEGGLHGGWARHPASRMWRGYELSLLRYQKATVHQWVTVRGFADTCWEKSLAVFDAESLEKFAVGAYEDPPWLGDEELHRSHQASLLLKDPEFYRPIFGDTVKAEMDYVWPGPSLQEAIALQEAEAGQV